MAIKVSGSTVVDNNKVFLPNNTSAAEASVAISSGTLTLDLNSATVFDVTLDSDISSIVINNIQAAGRTSSFVLVFTGDGNVRSVVWPVTFRWPSNIAPTITSTSSKKDIFTFFTVDNGSNWQAFISGQNL